MKRLIKNTVLLEQAIPVQHRGMRNAHQLFEALLDLRPRLADRVKQAPVGVHQIDLAVGHIDVVWNARQLGHDARQDLLVPQIIV